MKTASCINYRLIRGGGCSAFLAACEIRPPGMVEVQILQEQISALPSMDIIAPPSMAPYEIHSIHGDTLKSFLGNCSSVNAPALPYYRPSMGICIALLSDIHVTKTIFSIRPAWMQEVQITHGEVICHSIHRDTLKSFQTIFSIHSIHGDNRTTVHGSLRNTIHPWI